MVFNVKLVSMKYKIPSDLSVELVTNTENPRNLPVKPLCVPKQSNYWDHKMCMDEKKKETRKNK